MNGWMIAVIVAAWLGCGGYSAGKMYAYCQREWPNIADEYRGSDRCWAFFGLLLGPLGVFPVIGTYGARHGWLWPWPIAKFPGRCANVQNYTRRLMESDPAPMEPLMVETGPLEDINGVIAGDDADGWVKNDGGAVIARGTRMDVKYRDGMVLTDCVFGTTEHDRTRFALTMRLMGGPTDIIAYRLHESPAPVVKESLTTEAAISLELGKQYRRRDGEVVTVDWDEGSDIPCMAGGYWYRRNGVCTGNDLGDLDIIAEVTDAPVAPFTLRPDWSKAPEWAMWAAQDEDGELCWFEDEPVEHPETRFGGVWMWQDSDKWHSAGGAPANPNWRQAIEQRPAAENMTLDEGKAMADEVVGRTLRQIRAVGEEACAMLLAEPSTLAIEPESPAEAAQGYPLDAEARAEMWGRDPSIPEVDADDVMQAAEMALAAMPVRIPHAEYERLRAIAEAARIFHKTQSPTARDRLGKALGVVK